MKEKEKTNIAGNGIKTAVENSQNNQWYVIDPELLEMEKMAMERFFPEFELKTDEDGKLFWIGAIDAGDFSIDRSQWVIKAIYEKNHPQNNSRSVKVYLVSPSIDDLYKITDSIPHLWHEPNTPASLSLEKNMEVINDRTIASGASFIMKAVKWIQYYEAYASGEKSADEF